jgi:hypothetical protein
MARGAGLDAWGFSLLEVVIASAIVLFTVTAITACVASVSRAGQRMDASRRGDQALASVAEWLREIPYCADVLPAPSGVPGRGARDLVSAVFPHACLSANTEDARFVSVDEHAAEAGSFVTRLVEDGVVVVCAARFCGADGDLLQPDEVEGFDVTASDRVPGPVLELTLSTEGVPGTRSCRLVRVVAALVVLDPPEAAG